ncbi:MAG: methionyl-tRNA formyltransferase [Steroidobacteraceae bacterium]
MLRIVFAGTPAFALPALEALVASAHQVVGVLTQPDRPAGRGRTLHASAVKERALQLGLPVAQPPRLASEEQRAPLREWAPELLVVVAYGLILPPAVLALPRLGCLNIHASLLPRWRGAAPIQRAILAGDAQSGVSIMQLDAGLDTGPVYAQRALPVGNGVTSAELHDALAHIGASLLLEVISDLELGRARLRAQPASGVSYAAKLDKSEALIDWNQPAARIAAQVCACNPWPVAETTLNGAQLRLWRARAAEPVPAAARPGPAAAPGTVLDLRGEALLVACGSGVLEVTELQSAGRRRLGARDFAHGHASAGLRFG